jgi:hypothetical protein
VGCAPNAASLKKLEQLSKRRTQTALLFSTRQSAGDPTSAKIGLATPSHANRVVSLATTTSIAAPSEMN